MRTFLRIAAIIYVAYLVIALLLISPALNLLPHWYMKDTYDRELQTGWVLFNPFKVSLDISEATLGDDTGEPFLAFSEASINLSMESLWQPGWVLDAVKLRDLHVEITRQTENEYNFSDLLPEDDTETPPESEGGELPGVTIHDLELHSETILLKDNARETPYSSRWNGLRIHVAGISTVSKDGRPYIVDVEGDGGGLLHWEGDVSIPGGNSQGRLSISNLNLRNFWLFAQPWLQFELKDGRFAVEGEYQLDWSDAFSYRINGGQIGLTSLDIVPRAPDELPDTALGLKTLMIKNIALDSTTQRVTIDSITLDDPAVATWREESQISLEQLFALDLPASAEEESAHEDAGDAGWSVILNKAQLRNGHLHWRSQLTDPEILQVRPIEATLEHITWPLSGETRMSLNLAVNEQANIAANGTLDLALGNGSIEYTLGGLPLSWFNPNLPTALKVTMASGQVEVNGQVTLQSYAPSTVGLDGEIREFSARMEGAETTLTGWDSVRIEGLAVDMEAHSLVLEKLAIDSYTGRLHIQEDGSINASNIWKEEVGEEAQEIAQDLTQDKPWSFSLPAITITESEIDFTDRSLPIQFRTIIGELEGEILNISSQPDTGATVELKGSVDSYAPVALTGNFSPFATPTALDLNLTFDGVDMGLLSPYSSTYAGYSIDQGLLDLDLKYALKENRLKGKNSVRIDKLKLGEKVSSDKAVDLPLELALAILTDANGVIDMQVPVSGNVDDPSFELGGVISKAFVNILTKVITAPFSLLAGLVNSEEDLQRLTFSSGSANLKEANREKLTQLAAALTQRPNLSLVITGRLNLDADRERMQKNTLKVQLLEQGLSAEEIKSKGPDWEDTITERYEDLAASSTETSPLTTREQYLLILQSIEISDRQMIELAEQRAVETKSYLVNEAGLAPDRAVIGQASLDGEVNDFSGVDLGIEN